jgi:hypothetical protein
MASHCTGAQLSNWWRWNALALVWLNTNSTNFCVYKLLRCIHGFEEGPLGHMRRHTSVHWYIFFSDFTDSWLAVHGRDRFGAAVLVIEYHFHQWRRLGPVRCSSFSREQVVPFTEPQQSFASHQTAEHPRLTVDQEVFLSFGALEAEQRPWNRVAVVPWRWWERWPVVVSKSTLMLLP